MKLDKNDISLQKLRQENVDAFATYLSQLGDDPTIGPVIDRSRLLSKQGFIDKYTSELAHSIPPEEMKSDWLIIYF